MAVMDVDDRAALHRQNLETWKQFCSDSNVKLTWRGRRLIKRFPARQQRVPLNDRVVDVLAFDGPDRSAEADERVVSQIVIGRPIVAVVSLTRNGTIEVDSWSASWAGHRLIGIRSAPRRVVEASGARSRARELFAAVQIVARHRNGQLEKCAWCQQLRGPEYMHDRDCCMGCAERYLGIVH